MVGFILSLLTLSIRVIVTVIPIRAELINELGVVARKIGHHRIAAVLFSRAVIRKPAYAAAIFNLALTLNDLRDFEGAISYYQKSIQLKHCELDCELNMSAILQNLGRLDEALPHLERVLSKEPSNKLARMNLAGNWSCHGMRKEALSAYQAISAEYPDYAMAHFCSGLELLRLGQWDKGWEEYEWRFVRSEHQKKDLLAPDPEAKRWEGEDLAGRRILLRAEQGFGDTIQFCRLATQLSAMGATVSLSVQPALVDLMRSLAGVHQVCPMGKEQDIDPFELWVPLLSVAHLLKVNEQSIPRSCPYLQPDPLIVKKWERQLARLGEGPRVGLVWFGNAGFVKNWTRSFSIAQYEPLARIPCNFVSLQCGPRAKEADHPPQGMRLFPAAKRLKNFSQTAGAIANLDLVITVDTAVAHLAGALGKPVWTLLSFDAAWQWLLERDDSPWYPSMRLYRQTSLGDWDSVIDEVANDLHDLVSRNGLAWGRGTVATATR